MENKVKLVQMLLSIVVNLSKWVEDLKLLCWFEDSDSIQICLLKLWLDQLDQLVIWIPGNHRWQWRRPWRTCKRRWSDSSLTQSVALSHTEHHFLFPSSFYPTQVPSFCTLVTIKLTSWLTDSLLLLRIDWYDSGFWRCQRKTPWCCWYCWCWCWATFWWQFGRYF